MFIGPILTVLLCSAAIYYLFRMLQESDRIAVQKLEKTP